MQPARRAARVLPSLAAATTTLPISLAFSRSSPSLMPTACHSISCEVLSVSLDFLGSCMSKCVTRLVSESVYVDSLVSLNLLLVISGLKGLLHCVNEKSNSIRRPAFSINRSIYRLITDCRKEHQHYSLSSNLWNTYSQT